MGKQLVIVESPTKAKTLKKFLGSEFIVESSVGHVRDLPASASEIPADLKKEKWARLGVNVDDEFKPLYIVHPDKKKKISELKRLAKEVESILLATDEDREGEAISWHLLELLKPKVPVARMVFHEITKTAIQSSIQNTRAIDDNLVHAQEARRIVDRLYGYEISPILWRKIAPRLSAGRVQSVAIRMLVERERERMRFKPATYWDLIAEFVTEEQKSFPARLQTIDGKRLATGKDFDPDTGLLTKQDVVHLGEDEATRLLEGLRQSIFKIVSAEEKPFTRSPAAPFTTSTLQQEGNRKLRFDARRTMR
ncbi:MAG: DNA topoisomerase, partial [Planctomycetota bacterium]